ncbi:MAG: excinuclease ABC subunit UvrB [bacterium]|jgi:excinuclease ABC subunit B
MPERRPDKFKLVAPYSPTGDQPEAIDALTRGVLRGDRYQTLMGVTGSGKTYTIANVIERVQRPTLVISHNKTLAAQLCAEFREFFPENCVEYFVSYYDYYQPEAYVPATDTYIEKDSAINEEIDRLRHSATEALLTRRDVLVVASVSCIYGLGSPEDYAKLMIKFAKGERHPREKLIRRLVDMQYMRNNFDLVRGTFRIRGDILEIYSADKEVITRIEFDGEQVEALFEIDAASKRVLSEPEYTYVFPASHYVLLPERIDLALRDIESELAERLEFFREQGKLLEYQRLKERTKYDLEMIRNIGYCKGIENYARHLAGKAPGETPSNLLEYFPEDFLMIVDESHVTLPQLHGMYNGDRSRKTTLVDYGFRLPSALDNRPLKFEEWEAIVGQAIFVTATPGPYELEHSSQIVEQIIRPTGLVDPAVEVHPSQGQIDHLIGECSATIERGERVLVTTLTKKMAENLSEYLSNLGFKVQYLHSEVDTVERIRILKDLRLGTYDIVVGINLLREGLDLPEVSLVAILDADKEGFLRSDKSLIQTMGRAARNVRGRVLLYADEMTPSMARAIGEANRRREKQLEYNKLHGITPKSIEKAIKAISDELEEANLRVIKKAGADPTDVPGAGLSIGELMVTIDEIEVQMKKYAEVLEFEKAAELRDQMKGLQTTLRKKVEAESGKKLREKVR